MSPWAIRCSPAAKRATCCVPRTLRQKKYVDAMERHDLTFALGPAGTGKTFLAAVLAVRMLMDRKVERLDLDAASCGGWRTSWLSSRRFAAKN